MDSLPLSPQGRAKVADFLEYGIANIKDADRNNPEIRAYEGRFLFHSDFFFVDEHGDERWHLIRFILDDSQVAQGKLSVVYIDHSDGEWSWRVDG